MSVRAIDPVYTQTTSIYDGGDVPSGMPYVAIIRPRCRINTPFCPELNGEYDGESSLVRYVIKKGYGLVKLKEFVSVEVLPLRQIKHCLTHNRRELTRVILFIKASNSSFSLIS